MKRQSLDKRCLNVQYHRIEYHQIDQPTFLRLIWQQLLKDLNTNCEPIDLPGSHSVPFKVRLTLHEYTLVAKCTTADFITYLKYEAAVYKRLSFYVSVHLSNIHLNQPYYYEGIAELIHMMFLSFEGMAVHWCINTDNREDMTQQIEHCIQAIYQLGVLHQDVMSCNILWNVKVGQPMAIDFERVEIQKLQFI